MMARLLLCVGMAVLLVGCSFSGHPDCEVIQASALRAQFNQETSLDHFRDWVSNTYHVSPKTIRVIPSIDNRDYWTIYWEVAGQTYDITLDNGRVDRGAGISFNRGVPASHIVSCLGPPAQYYAGYHWDLGKYVLHLTLLYPDQGILATGARYFYPKPDRIPTIESTFGIYRLTFGPPGWTDQLQQSVLNPSGELYKPWPGNWKDIQIEIDPRAQP